MKWVLPILFLSLALLAPLAGCGGTPTDEGENYQNILTTEAGLILTEGEHPGGWGRAECTICHNLQNIHLVNRTGIAIDIESIHNQAIDGGVAVCASCHGTNGVP